MSTEPPDRISRASVPSPGSLPLRRMASTPTHDGALVTGWLRDHGQAPHEFRPRAEPSYFIRLTTPEGERTLWHPGLRRALLASATRPQIGDEIGIRRLEIRPTVSPESATRGPPAPRTHWILERAAFFAERAAAARALRDPAVHPRDAVRAHPELVGPYMILDLARLVAEREYADRSNREGFVSLMRETFALAAERGIPLPTAEMRLRLSTSERRTPSVQTRSRGPERTR